MKIARRIKIRTPFAPRCVRQARKEVRRWMIWFAPPAALLLAIFWMRLDQRFVAVCMLAFPVLTIRLVEAWGDYQQALQQAEA